jgi:hypothetical protein
MGRARLWPLFVAAGMVCLWPSAGRAATAVKLGGSGYSGTLSSNPITRQQQLLYDPTNPFAGSMSTVYDPGVVTLTGISAIQGYVITGAFVEVSNGEGRSLLSFQDFIGTEHFGVETGYVQVFFGQPSPTAGPGGSVPDGPPEGYTMQGHAGVEGQNTHQHGLRPRARPPRRPGRRAVGYVVGGAVRLVRLDPLTGAPAGVPFFQNLFGPGGFFTQAVDPALRETGLVW